MAALTVALNVASEVQKFLVSQAKEEVGLLWNFKDDLKMEKTLVMLEAVLHDAGSRFNKEEVVCLLLAELRDACYDIQDMLADYMLPYKQPNGQLGCILPVKVCFGNLQSRIVLAHMMKSMRPRLNKIAELKNKLALKETTALDMPIIDKSRQTYSARESMVLGRDIEQSQIVNLIINIKTSEQIFVIPIFGMGGLGKTTLAQSIFNDSRLKDSKHFDVWAWAYTGSMKFDVCNIGSLVISSLRNSEFNSHNLEKMSQNMKNEIASKRFLIVLDDVWAVDINHWNKLINMLKDSSKGSIIVVTTRIEKIAKDIASDIPYPVKPLSEDNCMLLFHQKALKSKDEIPRYPKLVEIGNGIIKKCGGVPLVANSLGSMLRSERDEKLRSYVRERDMGIAQHETAPIVSVRG